eukprot:scaffold3078_cov90-Isochrysis_galbana.AAC.4
MAAHNCDLVAGHGAIHAKRAGKLVERADVLDRGRKGEVLLKESLVLDVCGARRRVKEHDLTRVGPRGHRDRGVQAVEAHAASRRKGGGGEGASLALEEDGCCAMMPCERHALVGA